MYAPCLPSEEDSGEVPTKDDVKQSWFFCRKVRFTRWRAAAVLTVLLMIGLPSSSSFVGIRVANLGAIEFLQAHRSGKPQGYIAIAGSWQGTGKGAQARKVVDDPGKKGNLNGVIADIDDIDTIYRPWQGRAIRWHASFETPGNQLYKQDVLDQLAVMFGMHSLETKVVYYSGHGVAYKGDWCFEDDSGDVTETITFDEIMDLWGEHRSGGQLYLVIDACHSGAWVDKAEAGNRQVSIYASCRANEVSTENGLGGYFMQSWIKQNMEGSPFFLFTGVIDWPDQHPQAWLPWLQPQRMGM